MAVGPSVLSALVGEGAGCKSWSDGVRLEGFLLDKATVASKRLGLVHRDGMMKIGVPFGSEGGFREVQRLVEETIGFEEMF